ncbi:MAG: copper amine oxidase N-terminal domain-containing protein [Clostridia bacterium]|nr:copper amine oxidase N-terminal domain-containing protein [Clostridia bacterium]
MKKILALLLCLAMSFSLIASFAEEEKDTSKIEISFKVGDSTLLINGKEVTVETPYIAGEGTTLVPLRVITEAFGAEVLWEGETKTITLNYPDVTIILQIDNRIAKVNDHTEELPVAPTLSASGVTMVPLRFISETFGAEVGYNEGAITVTKSADDFGTTVSVLTQKEKIGDSYYGWTMNTPKNLTLSYKSFDGRELVFSGDTTEVELDIYDNPEDFSIESDFIDIKSSASSMGALVRADLLKDENGNTYYIIQVKDSESFIDARRYSTEDFVYSFFTEVTGNDATAKESILSILDSFKAEELTDAVYDLSEVKDGMRKYTDEDLKFSLSLPANYSVEESSVNERFFYALTKTDDDPYSYVNLFISSKTDKANAKTLAENDCETRAKYYNKEFSTISSVSEKEINGTVCYIYTHEIKGTKSDNSLTTDVFFDKGEYVYNFCFYRDEDAVLDVDAILATIKAEELDANATGTLLRNENDPGIIIPVKNSYWSMQIPAIWNAVISPSTSGAIILMPTAMQ